MPFWTALCSFFSPANAETGEKEIFEKFSRYSSPLSLHPTCPKIPHDPYPHLHKHTLQLPRHHALHLDRVWWTSPPAAYKYRGENRKQEGGRFFLRKRGTNRGAKFWRRTENRGGRTENRGEFIWEERSSGKTEEKGREGGKESEKARPKREEKSHHCTSTSASIAPPSHHRQHHHRPKIEEEQWQRVKRDERREKGIENRGKIEEKKNRKEKER